MTSASHARTHASAPAPARGSLQLEYDRAIERNTHLMEAARASGRVIDVRTTNGVRMWLVPGDLREAVGCMVAVVR